MAPTEAAKALEDKPYLEIDIWWASPNQILEPSSSARQDLKSPTTASNMNVRKTLLYNFDEGPQKWKYEYRLKW